MKSFGESQKKKTTKPIHHGPIVQGKKTITKDQSTIKKRKKKLRRTSFKGKVRVLHRE